MAAFTRLSGSSENLGDLMTRSLCERECTCLLVLGNLEWSIEGISSGLIVGKK